MLNVVVQMAGRGSRFATAGYPDPKPMIPVGKRCMFEWIIENIRPSRSHRFIFLALEEHLQHYPAIPAKLNDTDDALMIANSDQIVDLPIDDYLSAGDAPGVDGLIMTFWADDPKWSFCRLREDETVTEVVEKQVISNEATVGIYNFAHGRDFVRSADPMIEKNLRVNNKFYVARCYNQLIQEGAKILTARTGRERDGMYGLGIPADLEFFKTTNYFRRRMAAP